MQVTVRQTITGAIITTEALNAAPTRQVTSKAVHPAEEGTYDWHFA